jgi:hypothetical protein
MGRMTTKRYTRPALPATRRPRTVTSSSLVTHCEALRTEPPEGADLAAWARVLDGDPRGTRLGVRQQLTRWRVDADLVGLRESAELDRLSAEEHKDCLALWAEVEALLARCGP